jgi:hypothetical protein
MKNNTLFKEFLETDPSYLRVENFIEDQNLTTEEACHIGFSKLEIMSSFLDLGWLNSDDIPDLLLSCPEKTDIELKNWLWERKQANGFGTKDSIVVSSEPDPFIDFAIFLERNQDEIPLMIILKQLEEVYGKENLIRCFKEDLYKRKDSYKSSKKHLSRNL